VQVKLKLNIFLQFQVEEFKSIKKFKIFNTNNHWIKISAIEKVIKDGSLRNVDIIENIKVLLSLLFSPSFDSCNTSRTMLLQCELSVKYNLNCVVQRQHTYVNNKKSVTPKYPNNKTTPRESILTNKNNNKMITNKIAMIRQQ